MRVELRGRGYGERGTHTHDVVLGADGTKVPGWEPGAGMLGGIHRPSTGRTAGEKDVVGWGRGEGRRVERIVTHVRKIQLSAGHINGGAEATADGGW